MRVALRLAPFEAAGRVLSRSDVDYDYLVGRHIKRNLYQSGVILEAACTAAAGVLPDGRVGNVLPPPHVVRCRVRLKDGTEAAGVFQIGLDIDARIPLLR